MTQIISRNAIDNKREKRILIGLITSGKFCKEILPIIRGKKFNLPYFSTIVKWVDDYYSIYEKAPSNLIEDLFDSYKKNLNDEEIRLIDIFLQNLSDESQYEPETNEDYLIHTSIEYIEQVSINNLANSLQELSKLGKIEEAKKLLSSFKGVQRQISGWVNPFMNSEIADSVEYEDDILFSFPGALGEMFGPFIRGHFIAGLAPVKKGKTFFLVELAVLAMTYGLKVVFVSLEMDKRRMARRLYKKILSICEDGQGLVKYPCFDCKSNQENTCMMRERTNKVKLFKADGSMPEYSPDLPYKPCTYCREKKLSTYRPEIWYISENRPEFNLGNVRKGLRSFTKTFGNNNFRFKAYPRFSVGVSQLGNDIDMLISTENFYPDVIITDYADIFQTEKGLEQRHGIDFIWKTHARWASEYKCLVATVSQSSKEAWDAKQTKLSHTSENYRNPAHVDKFFSISSTNDEKNKGAMRYNLLANRDGLCDPDKGVVVLQNLACSQAFIDSEFL